MLQSAPGAAAAEEERASPHQHSLPYSVPAYLWPAWRQARAHCEGVLLALE